MGTGTSSDRIANKRGFGSNLRTEILDAAERLLATTGSSEALTLRAIAREAGIAAPSIYPHFDDRDAILDIVVTRSFTRFREALEVTAAQTSGGIEGVDELGLSYLRFARENPGQYAIMFERAAQNVATPPHRYDEGLRAFRVLLSAIRDTPAGAKASEADLMLSAQTLFAALHGITVLMTTIPGFPWLDERALVRNAIRQVCGD
ncbi:TetR/AcrR family transcriptional regulator [Mycetocola sp. JXN-3]|uniref:TetR/AcrR family transcriptional regulator n=1 Tax=Mycetocola sp. JXN-3 TaxID=2116510 RepID=UPI00165D1D24|nr:TetR/AcrR family transcriptional regulator [Mycetocola sp. JXN-3]